MSGAVRWSALGAGGLVAGVGVAMGVLYGLTGARMAGGFDVHAESVAAPADSASIAYGEHVYTIRGCGDCHGRDLGGVTFVDEAPLARLSGSNLTAGKGGVAPSYGVADWARSIRHGVAPDGSPLLFMPSSEYHPLSDHDLGALIAYIRSVPPVDRTLPSQSIRPLGRVLYLAGKLPLLHAELVDHRAPHPQAPKPGPTVEYGRYLATGCVGCHGQDLGGGPIPGAPPSWTRAANLTPHADGLGAWSREDFVRAMRRGVRPDGAVLDTLMPWRSMSRMTDVELDALWRYLETVPPVGEDASED